MLKIKDIRKNKNITQKELSELTGISQSFISEMEKGKYECNVALLCKLCKALKCSPNDLIDENSWK